MGENQFVMVSEWMRNGSINEFIRSHKDVDRFELVGFFSTGSNPSLTTPQQLKDVARGLIYMHDQGMVHGDLKGVCI